MHKQLSTKWPIVSTQYIWLASGVAHICLQQKNNISTYLRAAPSPSLTAPPAFIIIIIVVLIVAVLAALPPYKPARPELIYTVDHLSETERAGNLNSCKWHPIGGKSSTPAPKQTSQDESSPSCGHPVEQSGQTVNIQPYLNFQSAEERTLYGYYYLIVLHSVRHKSCLLRKAVGSQGQSTTNM